MKKLGHISLLFTSIILTSFKIGNDTQLPLTKGILQGQYLSYHENGEKKAVGQFEKNQRTGSWKIYDETGNLIHERTYRNNFDFEIIKQSQNEENPSNVYGKYDLTRNEMGVIEYPLVIEEEVIVLRRFKREIELMGSVNNTDIIQLLINGLKFGQFDVYKGSDDEFQILANPDEAINKIEELKNDLKIKIKVDWFYSSKREMSESRIIGICLSDKSENNSSDLYWFYYPGVRNTFGEKKIDHPNRNIQNVEDLFFFETYSTIHINEHKRHGWSKQDFNSPVEVENENKRIEISIIEMEHNIWSGKLTKAIHYD